MSAPRRHCGNGCATRPWLRLSRFEPTRRGSVERHRRRITAIRAHLSKGDLHDGTVYDAVRVRLIEIGEAVKGIDPTLLDSTPGVAWKEIARMRDHLTHHYFDTDHAIVADFVDHDLDSLADAVQLLMEQIRQGNNR